MSLACFIGLHPQAPSARSFIMTFSKILCPICLCCYCYFVSPYIPQAIFNSHPLLPFILQFLSESIKQRLPFLLCVQQLFKQNTKSLGNHLRNKDLTVGFWLCSFTQWPLPLLPSLVVGLLTSTSICHTCRALRIKDQVPQVWSSLHSSKIPATIREHPSGWFSPRLLLKRIRLLIWILITPLSPCSQTRPADYRCWCTSKPLGVTIWPSLMVNEQNTEGHQPATTSSKKLPPSSNTGIKISKTEHWQLTKHPQHGIVSAALNCVCGSARTAGYWSGWENVTAFPLIQAHGPVL